MAGYGPQYQSIEPQVQSDALPGRPWPHLEDEVSPAATGAPIGEGIENAGDVLARHAEAAENMARQSQAMDAENKLQTLSLQLTHDPQNGAFTKQGQAAFGLSGQYMPQWNAGAQQIVDSVPDPRARLAVQAAAAHMGVGLTQQLDAHEIQQHQVFAARTAQDSVNIAEQASAANYNNPQILAANHDRIDAALTSIGQTQGWSADQVTAAKQEAFSRLHGNVIDRMLTDGKVQMASAYLKTNEGEMDGESAFVASKAIETEVRQQQNDAKQDIADRYQDSLESAQYGLQNPISVSRDELNVLFPHDAQRRWDELQIVRQAGAQAKAYDRMSIDDIRTDLQNRQPEEGGPEALYNVKAYDILTRAAQRTITQRVADPAQFAQTRGSWQPLDFTNPAAFLQQLTLRARTQGEISSQIGLPVPLLSKLEGKQFSSALDQSSPAQAAALLGQLRQALPDQRSYDSLIAQVAPHSPVTAIAGSLINAPPKGSAPAWYDGRFGADPQVAAGIIEGERILAGKGEGKTGATAAGSPTGAKGFSIPNDTQLETYFLSESGGEHGTLFAGRPDTAESYFGAFKAYYTALAARKGMTSGAFDGGAKAMAQQAADAVLGHVDRFNHTDVTVPAGMDPSRFEDIAHQGVIEAARRAGVDPAMAATLADSAGLHELGGLLGSGRYALVDGNGRPIQVKGQPILVDLSGVSLAAKHGVTTGDISRALTQAADQRIGEAP